MSSDFSRDLKKFETNLVLQSEVIWDEILYLKKTWITNSFASSCKMIVSAIRTNMACLDS